ncbi:hypothetical protein CYLTODRAFT_224614 [Cylindrobasidium torrendii FP15055 ss-10]|uniref:C2H2-type domain-containing protein n=1 Tax=Cylindrobasidium torrendii FP15055 ss-10 TaxID=1314674 RepID=A0A0D7BHB8_9AGAR|nr:hypothetical protein CYLTODRAFT_224614 [Cylindrobasidium torrendii FP15055 ss-10]
MSHHLATDTIHLPPISQLLIPPFPNQLSTSQELDLATERVYGLTGFMAHQDSQVRRASYSSYMQPQDMSQSYGAMSGGATLFYDTDMGAGRSIHHHHHTHTHSTNPTYPYTDTRDETPTTSGYYSANAYMQTPLGMSQDSSAYGGVPNQYTQSGYSTLMQPHSGGGMARPQTQYAGIPAYTGSTSANAYQQNAQPYGHAMSGSSSLYSKPSVGAQAHLPKAGSTGAGAVRGDHGTYFPEENTSKTRYECSYCGKGFSRPSALKIHVISHTGDKGGEASLWGDLGSCGLILWFFSLCRLCMSRGELPEKVRYSQ